MTTISKDKQYRTRDGREVRIYATDGRGRMSVHGAIRLYDGTWHPCEWDQHGGYMLDGTESGADLIEVRSRITRERWVNVYREWPINPMHFSSKAEADAHAVIGRIACVKITIDCCEGDGL